MYSLLLTIIYVAFVSLGLPDSLIGAGWPVMHRDLGVPLSLAGIITMVIAGGTILSSLASERVTRRFGAGLVTAVSVGMTAAALVGFSFSDSFWMLCLWAIPYGLGAGAVDAALNNYVALHYAARHMNWLHSFWGLGASISPFIMSFALTSGMGWSSAYLIVGLIQVALTFVLLVSLPLWGRVNAVVPPGSSTERDDVHPDAVDAPGHGRTHVPLAQALRIPGVALILTAFFAYCALESTALLWASTWLVTDRDVPEATAAAFASLFLLGITGGRFLAGFFADRLGDRALIRGGFATVGLGAVLLALPLETDAVALAGLVLTGLGAAPIYPAIIHSTPVNFGRRNSQAIIGIQMAAAYTGSTFAPPLFGLLSAWFGLWLFPLFIGILAIMGVVMSERLNRLIDRRRRVGRPAG
ncbi:MFS transporter [Microbacterium sp. zg.Y1090]|uniref:MFS transporter n=1 Tax=Microbacterium TaxID=33882 RepID=UPI00214C2EE9|nr:MULTISPECIES: MFS transporter [unclassified Microbacterium]MCR2812450.1 MFS transporter [Microbacterium sp. zg.Y1084]MCR2817749.1 MFS transporter [Microbacterium sp. zg.Y1090]MDL5485608.1 MFS transporter [Microbacterium sp. zg-Y1211]WIM28779.1 MFS transporter [Microbacterium sp. zg-Y1090]